MEAKEKLSRFDLTMIVVGLVIGMGIFKTAATAAKASLDPKMFFLAWILGGFIALCGALTYAEIGSRFPVVGGYFRIFSYAYHPSIAFSINCIILISNASSLSAVALIGSEYINHIFFGVNATADTQIYISFFAIVLFYGVNLLGLKISAHTQNVLMIIKILMLLALISALFIPSAHYSGKPFTPATTYHFMDWIKALGVTLIAVSFTYGGYQQTINFGNEVKRPAQNIPKGIFAGIAIIIALYLLVNFSYYKTLGFEGLQNSTEIATLVTEKIFGATGGKVFSVLLFLSVLAYVNVLLLSNPRVMYAMSEDGVLPGIFKKKSKKKEVLFMSLTTFTILCIIILFFAKTFDRILSFTIFLDCFGMATSAGAIFMLRKKTKHLDGTGIYKMKFYPVIPILFIIAYSFVGISIAIDKPSTALTGIGVLAAFMLIYFLTHSQRDKKKPS
ncbi:MAG: APC family permease [Bacteroidetes bacterium]|nr:APC family permease [Bacteroidota bacterium]